MNGTETNLGGASGEEGESRPPFKDTAIVAVDQVIGHPERVVSQLLGQNPRGDRRRGIQGRPARSTKERRAGVSEDRDADAKTRRHERVVRHAITPVDEARRPWSGWCRDRLAAAIGQGAWKEIVEGLMPVKEPVQLVDHELEEGYPAVGSHPGDVG